MEQRGVDEVEKSENDQIFKSLYDLLMEGRPVGHLAAAIEQVGLFGIDRFGRFGNIKPESQDAKNALDGLAKVFAYENTSSYGSSYGDEPWQNIIEGQFINEYGWLKSELPDFVSIAEGVVLKSPHSSLARQENNNVALIGMLLRFIETGFGHRPHPEFSSLEDLANGIAGEAGDRNGMGVGTVLKKLRHARKLNKKTYY